MDGRTTPIAVTVLCVGLCSCAPLEDAPDNPPPSEGYVCPSGGYLNCMPIVPAERRAYCSADYRGWILSNCPNVEIVY